MKYQAFDYKHKVCQCSKKVKWRPFKRSQHLRASPSSIALVELHQDMKSSSELPRVLQTSTRFHRESPTSHGELLLGSLRAAYLRQVLTNFAMLCWASPYSRVVQRFALRSTKIRRAHSGIIVFLQALPSSNVLRPAQSRIHFTLEKASMFEVL